MLWYLSTSPFTVCNGDGAWPFSGVPFLGGALLTLAFTLGIAWWSWRVLSKESLILPFRTGQTLFLALVVATGFSHSLERFSSQCVLDYWTLPLFWQNIHFNLGDVSLTIGVAFFIGYWWWEYKHKS